MSDPTTHTFRPSRLGAVGDLVDAALRAVSDVDATTAGAMLAELAGASGRHDDSVIVTAALLVIRDLLTAGWRCAPVDDATWVFTLDPRLASATARDRHRSVRDKQLNHGATRNRLRAAADALPTTAEDTRRVIELLSSGPPRVSLIPADAPAGQAMWRCVRATWSMHIDQSAPGTTVAYVIVDARIPTVPLAIIRLKNITYGVGVFEKWLGVNTAGFSRHISTLTDNDRARLIRYTLDLLSAVRGCVRGGDEESTLLDGYRDAETVKRTVIVEQLERGAAGMMSIIRGDCSNQAVRDAVAGVRVLWQLQSSSVAELAICGAAPPFGALRVGKLAAGIAGSAPVLDAWDAKVSRGEVTQRVYDTRIDEVVPPLPTIAMVTAGLWPGHAAQYERAECGSRRWRKLGHSNGYGTFTISSDTWDAVAQLLMAIGSDVIRRKGVSQRMMTGTEIATRFLGLPPLTFHGVRRPLYGLGLVDDPGALLLGWVTEPNRSAASLSEVSDAWWRRWVLPRRDEYAARAAATPMLAEEVEAILGSVEQQRQLALF